MSEINDGLKAFSSEGMSDPDSMVPADIQNSKLVWSSEATKQDHFQQPLPIIQNQNDNMEEEIFKNHDSDKKPKNLFQKLLYN